MTEKDMNIAMSKTTAMTTPRQSTRARAMRCLIWAALAMAAFLGQTPEVRAEGFAAHTIGDYGNVTVMEVTGSMDYEGALDTLLWPRKLIAEEFYSTHEDAYDFLVIITDFDYTMPPGARAYYNAVRNNVTGIGLQKFDNTEFYASAGRLQGTMDLGNLMIIPPSTEPGYMYDLGVISHEFMHRWCCKVGFNDGGVVSKALLGRDGSHWSYLLDTDGSLMYGNDWHDNGNGTFTSTDAHKRYSMLDLYLMGLADASEVPPMTLIEGSGVDASTYPNVADTVTGTPKTATIEDIIAAEGARVPSAREAQRSFRTAFIYVTRPGTFTGEHLPKIEQLRNEWVKNLSVLTDGRAVAEVSVQQKKPVLSAPATQPAVPRPTPASVEDGVQWLLAQQQPDGSWADSPRTAVRDTTAAIKALTTIGVGQGSVANAVAWLQSNEYSTVDYLARTIDALAESANDVAPYADTLISWQNADGGWGTKPGYESNPTDTALALAALASASMENNAAFHAAVSFVNSSMNDSMSWGSSGWRGDILTTSSMLRAFMGYGDATNVNTSVPR
jgi:hypothetical protein